MNIILPLIWALATSIAAGENSFNPKQTIDTNTTMTTTETSMYNPAYDSLMNSLGSIMPSFPSQLETWDATVASNPAYQPCAPVSALVPESLSSAYAAWDSSETVWLSEIASGLGNIQSVDPQDVDSAYSWLMTNLCPAETPFFSSVFHAASAAAPVTATVTETSGYSTPSSTSRSKSGASSIWAVSVLEAVLSGMLAMVVVL